MTRVSNQLHVNVETPLVSPDMESAIIDWSTWTYIFLSIKESPNINTKVGLYIYQPGFQTNLYLTTTTLVANGTWSNSFFFFGGIKLPDYVGVSGTVRNLLFFTSYSAFGDQQLVTTLFASNFQTGKITVQPR